MFECGFLSLLSTVLTEMQGTIGMNGRDPKVQFEKGLDRALGRLPRENSVYAETCSMTKHYLGAEF